MRKISLVMGVIGIFLLAGVAFADGTGLMNTNGLLTGKVYAMNPWYANPSTYSEAWTTDGTMVGGLRACSAYNTSAWNCGTERVDFQTVSPTTSSSNFTCSANDVAKGTARYFANGQFFNITGQAKGFC